MDFDLSEEQRLLKESVDGLLGDAYDFDSRKKYMKEKGGWSKAIWSKFAEQGLLGVRRTSPREEEARTLARARIRDVEFTWATFLVRGMEQGLLPESDPRLLTRALLGLYNSIWHWYRPRGQVSLEEVTEFFLRRQLEVLGLSPEFADGDRSAVRAAAGKGGAGGKSGSTTRAARGRRRPTR